jgi:hypothetical protein
MSSAVILGLILLLRVILPALGVKVPQQNVSLPVGRLSPHALPKVLAMLLLALTLGIGPVMFSSDAVPDDARSLGVQWGLSVLALTLYQVPSLLIMTLLVPFGLVRTSYYVARVLGAYWSCDSVPEAATYFATRALLRSERPSAATVAFVQRRVTRARRNAVPGYVARALLLHRDGNTLSARQLLGLLEFAQWPRMPLGMRRAIRRFLIAEAAERGDWWRVLAIADSPRKAWDPWVSVVRKVAAARTSAEPDRAVNVGAMLALLTRTNVALRQLCEARSRAPLPVESPWAALGALAQKMRPRPEDVIDASSALESVLDSQVYRATLERRALALSAYVDLDALIASVREEALGALTHAALQSHAPLDRAKGALHEEALARASARIEEELQQNVDDMREHVRAKNLGDLDDEVELAAELFDGYANVMLRCDRDVRERMFAAVHYVAGNHGVMLDHSASGSRTLAHAIFSWLLEEAKALNRPEEVALETKNVKITR